MVDRRHAPGPARALDDMSVDELAAAAQRGRRDCFNALAERIRPRLRQFLLTRTRDPAEAEDVAQEALLRAYSRLADYDAGRRFSTWLYTIAARMAVSRRRAAGQQPAGDAGAGEPAAADGDPVGTIAVREEGGRLWRRAQEVLAARDYEALYLRYAEDLPIDEVAARLAITAVHARVLLWRARRRLAQETTS
jgi:RNA polymerase sigma-70 factor (ECF subfamily)